MSRGLYVALSGAVAQEQALETTAQNLANANTSGYQRMRPVFREVLAGARKEASGGAAGGNANSFASRARGLGRSPIENLRYTAVAQTAVDQSRGAIKQTGRGLDVVLPEGNYLAVSTPRGERYTRAGSITMGVDGILRTAGGTPLAREDGQPLKISADAGEPSIAADGSVMQNGEVVGKLKMIKGDTGTTFVHEGNGVSTARGAVVKGEGNLELGVVEESNATPVAAMTELVTATRTFEAFQKMLDTFGECDRKVLTTTPTATE